jgi:hypothetical protein
MSDKEFNELIDNELNKLLVNILSIQLTLITRALFFEFGDHEKIDSNKDYVMNIWYDFVKHKDEYLGLLKIIKK